MNGICANLRGQAISRWRALERRVIVLSRMAPPYYDHAGRVLDGRYELCERVGAGAFATVYRARDRNVHGRTVAVKVLHPERASDPATVQRFLREVKLAIRVTGKHRDRLVQILDQGYCQTEAPALLYFVMEFVEGPTLQRLLRQATGGVFAWRRAAALGHEVAQALVALHGHGVVHRDIKPGNCILEEDRVRLLDLGIAKSLPEHDTSGGARLTLPNMIVGTLRYMAPEQLSGHACDGRADLYAVGVMLYEFLTGGAPVFRELKEHPAINKPLGLVPPSVAAPARGIPAAIDAVVVQALQWRPEERFQSAAALADALAATLASEATGVWTPRARRLPARQRWLFAVAHAMGAWTLIAGTTVAAGSLAIGASLAHGGGGEEVSAALERDDSPVMQAAGAGKESGAVGATGDASAGAVAAVDSAVEGLAGAESGGAVAGGGSAPVDATLTAAMASGAASSDGASGVALSGADARGGASGADVNGAAASGAGASDVASGAGASGAASDAAPSGASAGGATAGEVWSTGAEPGGGGAGVERSLLVSRFAARRKQVVAECGPLCGLANPRGISAKVRVQVRPDGGVQARALGAWQGTPLGDCLERVARSVEFSATGAGGGLTWTINF